MAANPCSFMFFNEFIIQLYLPNKFIKKTSDRISYSVQCTGCVQKITRNFVNYAGLESRIVKLLFMITLVYEVRQ